MNDLHFVSAELKPGESVSPAFALEGLLEARKKSWQAFHEICNQIQEGVTEVEARNLAIAILAGMGATKHWHRPYVRLGQGTALSFHDPFQKEYQLKKNDPVSLDLGPVWTDVESGVEYEGDVGDTFVYGENPAAASCALMAKHIFELAKQKWKTDKLSGSELYAFMNSEAQKAGYILLENVDGHRLSDYPHVKHSKERLAKVPFEPSRCLWVLEVQIIDPDRQFGAFYEDLLL